MARATALILPNNIMEWKGTKIWKLSKSNVEFNAFKAMNECDWWTPREWASLGQ